MRYVVVGAGAVGSAVGVALLRAGRDVVFMARGAQLTALRNGNLTVATPTGTTDHVVRAVAAEEAQLASQDVLLLAVKSQDTMAAVSQLSRLQVDGGGSGSRLPVVCLQNGLENERIAQRFFDRVYAACVWIPGQVVRPGVVVLPARAGFGALDVGCYPSGLDDLSRDLAADVSAGGIVGSAAADTMIRKHYKLLANIGNVVTALFPAGADADEVAGAAQAEARAVVVAGGVDLSGLQAELDRVRPLAQVADVAGQQYLGNSTLQSLAGARSLETDYLNGEIVLLGRLLAIPTPVNRALQRLAARAERTAAAPSSYTRADLEEEMRS